MTSTQLVKALLDRINVYNPKVNCYITVMSKEALAQAAIPRRRAEGRQVSRPSSRAFPIGLKDNIDTAGTCTAASQPCSKIAFPRKTQRSCVRPKELALIIMGKLNLHEFALGCTGDISYFGP